MSMRSIRRTSSALLALAQLTSACAIEDNPTLGSDEQPLLAASALVWYAGDIPVCWLNPTDTVAMGWVRNAVEQSWQAKSGVRFSGWGTCAAGPSKGVRIRIEDTHPRSYLGTVANAIASDEPTMWLNFAFRATFTSCATQREYCIRAIAMHEFGHVMGFDHEQNRTDTPASCPSDVASYGGDVNVGVWDLSSSMNYCNPLWINNGKLSATDIKGAQLFYGPAGWRRAPWLAGQLTQLGSARVFAIARNRRPYASTVVGTSGMGAWQPWSAGLSAEQARFVTPMLGSRMFAIDGDENLYIRVGSSTSWAAWGSGLPDGKARFVTPFRGNHVFAIGTNDRLYRNAWDGTAWTGWHAWGNGLPYGQAKHVAHHHNTRMFAIGIDGKVYVSAFSSATGWSMWSRFAIGLPNEQAKMVTPYVNGLVLAIGTDDKLYARWISPTGQWVSWSEWGNGLPNGRVKFVTPSINNHVFAIGYDSRVYVRTYAGSWSTWSAWGDGLPGGQAMTITTREDASSVGHVVALGLDGLPYETRTNAVWGTWVPVTTGL